MRILQVTPFLGEQYGGTERYCINLSKELVKLGHEVEIFTSRLMRETPLKSEDSGIRIRRFYTPKVIWNINPLTIMLHKLLRSEHDIVHVHSYLYFSSNQAVLAKIVRAVLHNQKPLLLHLHGGIGVPDHLRRNTVKQVIKRIYDATIGRVMMMTADRILSSCISDANAAMKLFNIPKAKITIIYNGIDTSRFLGPEENCGHESRDILFVGDLEPWKGVDTLIEGMRILQKRGEEFTLRLVGEGSLRPQLEAQADGLDVEFLGQVPHSEIPDLMRTAFALVLPSLWEGIPTVGLEAMASGTPFIGTNVGGIPEIVHDKVTGLLVPCNSPAKLADAILRLTDEKLRQELVRNAYRLVKSNFDISYIAKKTERLYEIMFL